MSSRAVAGSIEPGKVQNRRVSDDAALQYFLYVPKVISRDMPHCVSVHGISRNAGEHAALFAPLAERYGVVLVAPVFSRRHFGDYQRLGRRGSGRAPRRTPVRLRHDARRVDRVRV